MYALRIGHLTGLLKEPVIYPLSESCEVAFRRLPERKLLILRRSEPEFDTRLSSIVESIMPKRHRKVVEKPADCVSIDNVLEYSLPKDGRGFVFFGGNAYGISGREKPHGILLCNYPSLLLYRDQSTDGTGFVSHLGPHPVVRGGWVDQLVKGNVLYFGLDRAAACDKPPQKIPNQFYVEIIAQ